MRTTQKEGNNLFPVFFKLEQLNLLIVGGGFVGFEKLTAVLTNSPKTNVKIVSKTFSHTTPLDILAIFELLKPLLFNKEKDIIIQ